MIYDLSQESDIFFKSYPLNCLFFVQTKQLIDNNLIIKPISISENEYTF